MSTIKVEIDLEKDLLKINTEGNYPLQLPLSYTEKNDSLQKVCHSRVCGYNCTTYKYGQNISEWFSKYLGVQVHLVRVSETDTRHIKYKDEHLLPSTTMQNGEQQNLNNSENYQYSKVAFANESQYLLVSKSSLESLIEKIPNQDAHNVLIDRFRGNFIINGSEPYVEDSWCKIAIHDQIFEIVKLCSRCQMVNIDQKTGTQGNEPLRTLAACRRNEKGQILFGILLVHNSSVSQKPFHLKSGADIKVLKINKLD